MLDDRYLSQLPALRSRLVRTAARLLGTQAEAEDVVQDAYLRALEAGDVPTPTSTQAWLTTVMRNLALDRLRRDDWMRRWLRTADAQASEAPSAEAEAMQAESVSQALRLLAARLPPADGAALLLREVFEASFNEIAQASGKTEAASRQQMHRALLRLRRNAHPEDDHDSTETEARFQLYRQAIARCDPAPLRALLQPPPTHACAAAAPAAATPAAARAACQVVHIGGQLGLVLTLGGKVLCVLPLEADQAENVEGAVH